MSLSHKRDNILFCIFLLLVILIAILITYLLINNHKKNKLDNNVHFDINEIKEFKFKDVTEADVVDVFTKYPINPIDINFANNSVSISGLKDKNVEVTRLAHGLPMGANLDYADELTLIKAMEGRIKQ